MNSIQINNLWKQYQIGKPKLLTKAIPLFIGQRKTEKFWALRGVSLTIKKGEKMAIIGPNGSGKTTLLKILAGITFPNKGDFVISGKVASLLELGTGFHPELTGRENIYLYGSILGVTKSEIDKNFEEIVSFSGIKRFLDTPVKHYSSGMYIRLAFSVASNLDWDILFLDEIFSVGDAEFQEKSFIKMQKLFSDSKILIFVSHDMNLVKKLCDRAVLLKSGKIEKVGKVESVVSYYLKSFEK